MKDPSTMTFEELSAARAELREKLGMAPDTTDLDARWHRHIREAGRLIIELNAGFDRVLSNLTRMRAPKSFSESMERSSFGKIQQPKHRNADSIESEIR